jgi:hypothetical protein
MSFSLSAMCQDLGEFGRMGTPACAHAHTLLMHITHEMPRTCYRVMLVGWGGNNGTTVTAGILANKQ